VLGVAAVEGEGDVIPVAVTGVVAEVAVVATVEAVVFWAPEGMVCLRLGER
jgi:hypothetical protein